MCNIDPETQAILGSAFDTYLSNLETARRSNFTAMDFVRTAKLEIPRPIVSRWLQDRFNHSGMIGWASTITQEGGPILYFQVAASSPAGRRVATINAAIAIKESGLAEAIDAELAADPELLEPV